MIDKMKECAAKYYKQQEDVIEEKNKEISMLIENKNKEVTSVIQERKRSLDEKSKEVSKIVQEKQKVASKLTQALNTAKEELDMAKIDMTKIDDKNKALEDQLREMIKNIQEKSKEISRLEKEKKIGDEEKITKIAKLKQDKDLNAEEKNKEITRMVNENRKEVAKITETFLSTKNELNVTKEQLNQLKTLQTDVEHKFAMKEQEVACLKKSLDDTKKKNEFKSNIERSFESLQNQYQMKVDELERVKRQVGNDEKKRRTSDKM